MKKAPFAYFDELRAAGVTTAWGEPSALSAALPGAKFDVVIDNNGKDMDAVGPVIAHAAAAGASQFLFVSSAGVYKVTEQPPHVEGDAVKADAGHILVEQALAASGMAWSSFRPQYLTGAPRQRGQRRSAAARSAAHSHSHHWLSHASHASDKRALVRQAMAPTRTARSTSSTASRAGARSASRAAACR
jgi:hypothetical protein